MRLLPILNYHHVGVRVEPTGHQHLWVSRERFSEHMKYLAKGGYRCLALRDCAPILLKESPAPERVVALTFDDGYANFLTHAYPVLQQHGFSATLAVVTGNIGGSSVWDLSQKQPLLGWDNLFALSRAGIEIASHTVSHACLTQLTPEACSQELLESRRAIETNLGESARTLIYPYGAVNPAVEEASRCAGYSLACSTILGNLHRPAHLFRLKRVPMHESVTVDRLRRRLSPIYDLCCRLREFKQVLRDRNGAEARGQEREGPEPPND